MVSQLIYILFGLHLLLAVIYAIDFRYDRGSLQNSLLRFVVCFFIPIFGFAFMWFSDYFERRAEKVTGREALDLQEKTAELELLKPLDLEEEVNKVPMLEALQMGDSSFRRKVVVDTLKEDAVEYIDVLREALLNDDTETSHYASSVIMDIEGKLQASLLQKEVNFHENMQNREAAYAYEQELYKVIKSGLYEKRDLHKHYVKYKVVSDVLFAEETVPEVCLHNRIDVDFETGDIRHAEKICSRYKKEFPSSEEMVVDHIKLYIRMQDKEALDKFLQHLKELPVLLTAHSLQYIRFFERENG